MRPEKGTSTSWKRYHRVPVWRRPRKGLKRILTQLELYRDDIGSLDPAYLTTPMDKSSTSVESVEASRCTTTVSAVR
jgi:hypothetical protein